MAVLDFDEDLIDYDDDDLEVEKPSTQALGKSLTGDAKKNLTSNHSTEAEAAQQSFTSPGERVTVQPSANNDFLEFGLDDQAVEAPRPFRDSTLIQEEDEIDYDEDSNVGGEGVALNISHQYDGNLQSAHAEDEIDYDDSDNGVDEPVHASTELQAADQPHVASLNSRSFEFANAEDDLDYGDSEVPDEDPAEIFNQRAGAHDFHGAGDDITFDDDDQGGATVGLSADEDAVEEDRASDFVSDKNVEDEITYVDDDYGEAILADSADHALVKGDRETNVSLNRNRQDEDEITYTDDEGEAAQPYQDEDDLVEEYDYSGPDKRTHIEDQPRSGPTDNNDKNDTDMREEFTKDEFVKDELVIPYITVAYRGDEYPLFPDPAEDDKMVFFHDLSVVDWTIDALLAGFRKELSDDLRPDEELVFQIDELGLEYAESTDKECSTGVTFRHLLQIFDQLVKNQDPDASRSLYTFLFTRLHPGKRLETLIEKTYAGNPLDSVAHYFRAPVIEDAVAGNEAQEDGYDLPEGSVQDEGRLREDYNGTISEDGNAFVDDGLPNEIEASSHSTRLSYEKAIVAEQQGGDLTPHDQNHYDDTSGVNSPSVAPVDWDTDHHEVEDERALASHLNDSTVNSAPAQVNYLEPNGKSVSPTRTSTVIDDDTASRDNCDLTGDQVSPGLQTLPEKEPIGELDEIDWRDEPEALPYNTTASQSSFAILSKRSRSEEDSSPGVEDGQDVKRRRP